MIKTSVIVAHLVHRQASQRIGEIVFDLVAKIVGREVDESAHQDLINEAVAALNTEAARGSAS